MSTKLTIECGPADEHGRRFVIARCAGREHRDRFDTDDAFKRRQFQNAVVAKFGLHPTDQCASDLETRLIQRADTEDACRHAAPIIAADSVCLADVTPSDVAWLWPGRIALGKVTLLAGDPGLGKSMLTLDMAARVSRGARWPDEAQASGIESHRPNAAQAGEPLEKKTGQGEATTEPISLLDELRKIEGSGLSAAPASSSGHRATSRRGTESLQDSASGALGETRPHPRAGSVVLLSAEDDLADTVRPRLEAHGADLSRIVAVSAIKGKDVDGAYRRSFDLSRDLEHLSAIIARQGDCRLVIIDPISAYLGRANENTNAEVRSLLAPLAALAAERGLAVVVVTHLRKEEGAAIYRTMGSLAFVAAARAAWVVSQDSHDPARRLFLPVKNNLAPDVGGLAYRVEPQPMSGKPVVCWSAEPVDGRTDELMRGPLRRPVGRPPAERDEVATWLVGALRAGPRPCAEIRDEALARGYTFGTLRRAFHAIGGETHRDDALSARSWMWRLPTSAPAAIEP